MTAPHASPSPGHAQTPAAVLKPILVPGPFASPLFAQSTPALPGAPELPTPATGGRQGSGFNNQELLIVLGCALALSVVLFFWAFFIRKRPKSMRGALVVERARRGSSKDDAEGSDGRKRRRKRRPDHPDNWGRNPTLGETGGLPPVRPAGEDNDSASDDSASDGSNAVPRPQ